MSHGSLSQEAEGDECWCSAFFLPFIQSKSPGSGHIQSGPSHHSKPNLDDPSQGFVSLVTLGPVTSTIAISHQESIALMKTGEEACEL